MPRSEQALELEASDFAAASLAELPDAALLEQVQRQTFRFFWEGAHPLSGLAPDGIPARNHHPQDLVAVGGSGFGIMAILAAVESGWVTRDAALERLGRMLDLLTRATCYHGVFPHFLDGRTGATIPFMRKDDGGDLVETSLLCMGLLCARQYFQRDHAAEKAVRDRITYLWDEVEWDWHTRGGRDLLYWHWSPWNDFDMNFPIRGWNECLITYIMSASSPTHAISPEVYFNGWVNSTSYLNDKTYYGIKLPLGFEYGGPLFFAHYTFMGIDPHELKDWHTDYWEQNRNHTLINRAWCVDNPKKRESLCAFGGPATRARASAIRAFLGLTGCPRRMR